MKSARRTLTLLLLLAVSIPGVSCGPFFAEALFVVPTRPDVPYAEFARGKLGVPQGGWRLAHLVVAYDWLSGRGLSAEEQRGAAEVDRELSPAMYATGSGETTEPGPAPGLKAWIEARRAAEGAGLAPSLGEKDDLGKLGVDRSTPGQSYQSFTNCLDDAFVTAAQTLAARRAAHAAESAALTDWVGAQDAVFANCNGGGDRSPAPAPGAAATWLRQDRAYQAAAAKFYALDYDGAIAGFRAIGGDRGSPWQVVARLAVARAMIRRATVGLSSDLPAAAQNVKPNNFNYEAEQQFEKVLAAKRPARLAEAREALNAIVADPSLGAIQPSARRLLDFLALRLEPGPQATVLASRVAGTAHAADPASFRQAVIDLRYLRAASWPGGASGTDKTGLLQWVQRFGAEGEQSSPDPSAKTRTPGSETTASDAFAVWRQDRGTPDLLAAMAAASPGDSAAPELVRAASGLPRSSPGWPAIIYHRLRLSGPGAAARAELDTLLPALSGSEGRSAINLFTALRQRSAPTLRLFLAEAGTLPAGINFDTDEALPPDPKSQGEGLCGAKPASEAGTLLFDDVAATVLNTRLPLPLLAQAAESPSLAPNLRFGVAQAAWTRAVLLHRPEIAKRLSPVLSGCYPAWKPVLARYDGSLNDEDREANGLLALMRFASTEPLVRTGSQRPEGFATYSEYRDNWWTGNKSDKPTEPQLAHRFFGSDPFSRELLPDPPFISAADRAAAQREVAALLDLPCASDYFAGAALGWYKAHPADPRTPDILGYAERVVRNGCRTDATKELNHQLFVAVQSRFPKSEWASKYRTWE